MFSHVQGHDRTVLRILVGLAVVFAAIQVGTGVGNGLAAEPGESHDRHAASGPNGLHTLLELVGLLVGGVAVAAAVLAAQTMRGGHMQWAFFGLAGGVVASLGRRLWHSVHEFGLLPEIPALGGQLWLILATGLLAAGFVQVYRTIHVPH